MKNYVICDWLKITRDNRVIIEIFSCAQAVSVDILHSKLYHMEVNRNKPHIHDVCNWLYFLE